MENQEIIELLQRDIEGEHQAIVTYLLHAYEIGESGLAAEIEAIAREEMRHLDWLADIIAGLDGNPTMEPAPIDTTAALPSQQMLKDVGLEETAIRQYRDHLEVITDPKIRLVLSRILHDELQHHRMFGEFAQEAEGIVGVIAESNAAGKMPGENLDGILNDGVRHEYTVVLQYLFHAFKTKDKELAEEWQDIAVNEMQHAGWLSEALASRGGRPDFTHTEMVLTPDAEVNLKADITAEREVTQIYSKAIPELKEPGLVELVERIRDHEIFHDAQFNNLLADVEAEEETEEETVIEADVPIQNQTEPTIPTVGSLKSEADKRRVP